MENKMLVKFRANEQIFEVYGKCELIEAKIFNAEQMYIHPVFEELIAKKLDGEVAKDYKPTAHTWYGRLCDEEDIIGGFITSVIRSENCYESLYICQELQTVVDFYLNNSIMLCTGSKVPQYMLALDLETLYEAVMLTDKYYYYCSDERYLMLNAQTHSVLADNEFAESGYCDSAFDILHGREKLLWGTVECDMEE